MDAALERYFRENPSTAANPGVLVRPTSNALAYRDYYAYPRNSPLPNPPPVMRRSLRLREANRLSARANSSTYHRPLGGPTGSVARQQPIASNGNHVTTITLNNRSATIYTAPIHDTVIAHYNRPAQPYGNASWLNGSHLNFIDNITAASIGARGLPHFALDVNLDMEDEDEDDDDEFGDDLDVDDLNDVTIGSSEDESLHGESELSSSSSVMLISSSVSLRYVDITRR